MDTEQQVNGTETLREAKLSSHRGRVLRASNTTSYTTTKQRADILIHVDKTMKKNTVPFKAGSIRLIVHNFNQQKCQKQNCSGKLKRYKNEQLSE